VSQVYLLDIEGTTTPISFVYDILFPFARGHFGTFLAEHWGDAEVRAEAVGLSDPAPQSPADATAAAHILMDQDRTVGALKSLQGRILEAGYRSGQLKSQLFGEVADRLRAYKAAGARVFIYSSGSVLAQKLLFAHTAEGDLTGLLDGYFDTAVGAKGEPDSYRRIAEQIGATGLFATDILSEAQAARSAGWQAVILNRPGNHPQPAHDFKVLDQLP